MADLVFPGAASNSLNGDAMPSNYDLVIYKGDYVELFLTINDSSGNPVSLSNATPKAQLKLNYSDTSPVNFTCSTTGTTGQVRVYLPSSQASTLLPGSYIWDVQITFSSGDTRTYLTGDVTVYNEVTT